MPHDPQERLDLVNALHHAVTQVVEELGRQGSRIDEIEKDLTSLREVLKLLRQSVAIAPENSPQHGVPS